MINSPRMAANSYSPSAAPNTRSQGQTALHPLSVKFGSARWSQHTSGLNLSSVATNELRERSPRQASLFPSRARRLAHGGSTGACHRPHVGTLSHERASSLIARTPSFSATRCDCCACCTGTATSCCSLLDAAVHEATVSEHSVSESHCPLSSAAQLAGTLGARRLRLAILELGDSKFCCRGECVSSLRYHVGVMAHTFSRACELKTCQVYTIVQRGAVA